MNVEYKIDYISKTESCTKKKHKSVSEYCASYEILTLTIFGQFQYFSFVSVHSASFMKILTISDGGERGDRTNQYLMSNLLD